MSSHTHTSTGTNGNGAVVGVHYQVGKKIGEGSFGVVFEGINTLNGQAVAIKFEPRKSDAPQLRDEYRSYRILNGCYGVPQVYYFGQEGLHNVLVIDLFGPNLEDLFDLCGRKFSVKTVAMAAKQMITRVQTIHEKNLIYRDIKPDNFLIGPSGSKSAGTICIIDFGMAKLWRDPKTKQHIPYRERKSLSGTARYMSINTHLGREQSRRDDLEGLGHVFMYFLRGGLPWQGLKAATNKQKYEKIGEKKQSTSIKDLCEGFPEEFGIYLNYVRKLGFEENPDYDFLRELFSKVLKNAGEEEDNAFDWTRLNNNKGWEAGPTPASLLPPTGHHTGNATGQRPRDRGHRASAQQVPNAGGVIPPSPALVRHGSKQRKHSSTQPINGTTLATPITPNMPTPSGQQPQAQIAPHVNVGGQHPYASPMHGSSPYAIGLGAHGRQNSYPGVNTPNAAYGGSSAVPTAGTGLSPLPISNARIRGGDLGIANTPGFDGIQRQPEEREKKKSLLDFILCRCG